jgi:hypothetical protein
MHGCHSPGSGRITAPGSRRADAPWRLFPEKSQRHLRVIVQVPHGGDELLIRDLGYTPEIATELGHLCVAWAALEFRMFCLFNRLSDLPVALARASFYSHRSTRDRGDLILTTAKMVLRGSQKREAAYTVLAKLLRSINRTAGKRNAYIHDPWAMEPDRPETVCQMRLSGSDLHGLGHLVSQKDLSQLTDQIVVWTNQLRSLDDRVAPLLRASLGKLDRTRFVALAFEKTKRHRQPILRRPAVGLE